MRVNRLKDLIQDSVTEVLTEFGEGLLAEAKNTIRGYIELLESDTPSSDYKYSEEEIRDEKINLLQDVLEDLGNIDPWE